MLFKSLGDIAAKHAFLVLAAWIALVATCISIAPKWDDVVQNGEFAFLPKDAPSQIATKAFREAFPNDMLSSTLVLLARRESGGEGLLQSDFEFLSAQVIPEIHRISGLVLPEDQLDIEAGAEPRTAELPNSAPTDANGTKLVDTIQWFADRKIGDLLISEDKHATTIVIGLRTEFLDQANSKFVNEIEAFVQKLNRTPSENALSMPAGLEIAVSGSATFGRDMMRESRNSAKSTEKWTIILVVGLLIAIYRAPMLAMIPLITVAVSTLVSLKLLSVAAQAGWISLFNGIETYVTVLIYGAGVDYCLFLIARYREELSGGQTIEESISGTLQRVGEALTASAGTVICGIGMLVFAEFGKFRQAGLAITFGLTICLLAALTLTPAILRLIGRWAFWPNVPAQRARGSAGFPASSDLVSRLQRANLLTAGWHWIGGIIERHPWRAWALSLAFMLPFSVAGILFFGKLSYGLLSELPESSASVYGAAAVQKHFPAGEVAPLKVMIEVPGTDNKPGVDFSPVQGDSFVLIQEFTNSLLAQKEELGLNTVRSLSAPKGQRPQKKLTPAERIGQKAHARNYFVSAKSPTTTRVDLIFKNDPFARSSITEFRYLRDNIHNLLPDGLRHAKLSYIGTTPDISDLKDVTDSDQIRIDSYVLLGVYLILVVLLRKPGICGYLMFTVFYSYFATIGFTFLVYWAMDPEGFAGLDWKVPMFLFTILIAVGEDYNIFLMTRIEEEQKIHGPVKGITVALEKTGSIISSCGIIMAGTFASLMAGSLVGMDQLGLALAVGVLLDTFVVRPVMVPAFLVLLTSGRLGVFSRLGGYHRLENMPAPPSDLRRTA